MAWYLDTSAAVKLVLRERGSAAMRRWVEGAGSPIVASDLLRTELLRSIRRVDAPSTKRARQVIDGLTLLALTPEICERAGLLDPSLLRSLDAIHLASALALGDELDGMVTYDDRLAAGAAAYGIVVVAPR